MVQLVRVTCWDKFKLLLWKNWILQWNAKVQLIIEILLPVIFCLLLVLVRVLVEAKTIGTTEYPALNISNLNLFKTEISQIPTAKPVIYEILYSPQNDFLDEIVKKAAETLLMDGYKGYPNAAALEKALTSRNYLTGIQFDDSWTDLTNYPKDFSFALRFPSELRTSMNNLDYTWQTMSLFPALEFNGPRNRDADDGGLPVGYLREGFLPVQNALTMAYIKLVTQNEDIPYVDMQRYPYPAYISDPLVESLSFMMSLIIILSFLYPCAFMVKSITTEKEKQLKEVMKIMGLNNWIHWTAWFVKSFIMLAISCILIVILLKIEWSDDVAVLTYTDWSVLLFFMWIYVITSICFCFMMSTLFSKASTAAAVTGLLWFITYMPYEFSAVGNDNLNLGAKLGWSLLSNSAMGFAFKLILEFEGSGEGFQWNNLFTPVNADNNLTIGYIVIMMLASCVIYMCICLYVEQIFPGEYGVPRKWNFIFTTDFWCGEKYIEDLPNGHIECKNADAFEPQPMGKHVGVRVKNLKKKFGNKMAVNGLSINMYSDEITVLLGHNGAGKTTTISILTGMFPPTSGTAIINGSDIRTNIEGARMSLGICPQHNVLFDDLTVAEHLIFFSRLKGLKGDAIQKEVDKYIRLIELEDKANVASKNLSGGMKRKLSVCCALTGDTKVVLCDEPSSGMDPSARRQLWDLLQKEKVGRTVLLTTHFMDEADVLGDRIAIMCDGELKCHGTSFFLKKKYGSGYRLICVKRDGCSSEKMTALLAKYIPNIKPESDIGAELSYQLPDNYSSQFKEMFGCLEEQSDSLNLDGYGISITSLEEVFIKVGAENAQNGDYKAAGAIMNGGSGYAENDIESIQSDRLFSENTRLLRGFKLLTNQWNAMLLKKFLHTYRNKLMFLVQNVVPIIFVVLTISMTRIQSTFKTLQPLTISLTQYPLAVTTLEISPDIVTGSLQQLISDKYKNFASHGSDYEFQTTGNRNFSDYILNLGRKEQVRINSKYLASASITNEKITAWLNNQPLHTAPLTVNLIHNAIIKALMDDSYQITVTNAPLSYSLDTKLSKLSNGYNLGTQFSINLCFCFCFVSSFYILFPIRERESRSKLLQFVGGVNVWTFWVTQFLWDFLTFVLTALIVICTLACFQEEGYSSFDDLARYFSVILIFGCAAIPFTYWLSFHFNEPALGFSRVSGMNIFAGIALFIVVVVMSTIDNTAKTADTLGWIFRIFPHFSLAMGLNQLYINSATRTACSVYNDMTFHDPKCNTVPYFSWEEPGVLSEIVYMLATAVGLFLILISREFSLISELKYKCKQRNFIRPPPANDGSLDDDVNQERQRILNMSPAEFSLTNLVLDRVTKYYDKFLAVNEVSLCVKPIECFGLLGVNGAGKTTTFKMMTGDERISFGSAYIKGKNLATDMNEIYKEIGYCPQFDALLDDLSGREHLQLFCLIRGVDKNRIPQITEELARSFGFIQHLDKPTKAYSGGNKRKLSTAIAVIGSPSVIYLDEPTTGMDPAARRQLWNMVCRVRDSGKSIVLTSHSMEECEALCTRLAIMVNGEFKCIGSTQHLKNRFSKGLVLKIKVKRNMDLKKLANTTSLNTDETSVPGQIIDQDIYSVKAFVEKEFSQAFLKEEYQGVLTFYIPLTSIKWSKIFGLMEHNRDILNIEDYSISQTTLEEIFLDFAKHQREDSRQIR